MRPKIGITCASMRCSDSVQRAGGIPVSLGDLTLAWDLSPREMEMTEEIVHDLDGILIPGGVDIHPDFYREERHRLTNPAYLDSAHCTRDRLEFCIAGYAIDADIPLLGICRGHQMMNVAAGGTLVQDIEDVLGIQHRGRHPISIVPDTVFADLVSKRKWARASSAAVPVSQKVNSYHHQAVGDLGNGFEPTAFCSEGVIEGIELPENRFCIGIQSHPEFDSMNETRFARKLFDRFVQAAAG